LTILSFRQTTFFKLSTLRPSLTQSLAALSLFQISSVRQGLKKTLPHL
jgi:hypothetical protein